MTKQFQVGQTYSTRSICDYDCIFSFAILGRTEKTIKINYNGSVTSRKIRIRDGIESIYPMGSYSMAPVLTADDTSDKIEAQLEHARQMALVRQIENTLKNYAARISA